MRNARHSVLIELVSSRLCDGCVSDGGGVLNKLGVARGACLHVSGEEVI